MKRYRVHFNYIRDIQASSLEDAQNKAEWLRVGVGAGGSSMYPEFDNKLVIEIVSVTEVKP